MRPRLLRLTVQYVAEADPLRGCLLELYAHTVLKTKYNVLAFSAKKDNELVRRSLGRS
jgi:hypothetical protein